MLPVTKLLCKYKFSLKAISVIIFAAVCITNIYYSSLLSDHFTSPHEYLRRELIAGKPPIVVINFSAAAQSNDFDTEYDVDQNKLDSLQAAVIADYQEYNVIVRGEVRNVPLWLRRLHKKANISSTFNYRSDPGDGGKYYFLTELLQVFNTNIILILNVPD
jgi:hypothetical protein